MSDPTGCKRIGELNGKWSILLRAFLAVNVVLIPIGLPSLIAFCVWIVNQQYADIAFRSSTERFSQRDAAAMKAELLEKINDSPGAEWKARVIASERFQSEVLSRLARIETKLEK